MGLTHPCLSLSHSVALHRARWSSAHKSSSALFSTSQRITARSQISSRMITSRASLPSSTDRVSLTQSLTTWVPSEEKERDSLVDDVASVSSTFIAI
jgi:hypothetical protein